MSDKLATMLTASTTDQSEKSSLSLTILSWEEEIRPGLVAGCFWHLKKH